MMWDFLPRETILFSTLMGIRDLVESVEKTLHPSGVDLQCIGKAPWLTLVAGSCP